MLPSPIDVRINFLKRLREHFYRANLTASAEAIQQTLDRRLDQKSFLFCAQRADELAQNAEDVGDTGVARNMRKLAVMYFDTANAYGSWE